MANGKFRKVEEKEGINRAAKESTKDIIIMLLILAVLTVLIFNLQGIKFKKLLGNQTSNETKIEPLEFVNVPFYLTDNITVISMNVPAVDKDGNGVPTILVVEAVPGSGRILVGIDNLLFWADTQQSIRVARNVAANISGINVNNYDLIYNIYANATTIGGPSAGAALAIATIAALEKKQLRNDVMITGNVNHDGTIGPVDSIYAKAQAAKMANASLMLVPLLQSRDIVYETKQSCEKFGTSEVCTSEQIPRKTNITNETGVEVIEVGTIQDALKYFLAK